ncbi:hypothetical protein ABZX92_10400 [Lentzea sp. NPDC006480]|uniref:hypothetical protein n=1 Tax=Lentzea sp. NPDC006480 TaxID=3157176 RepID=UPI0033A7E331
MIRKTTAAALVLSAVPAALALSLFSGTAQADDDTPWGKVAPTGDTSRAKVIASDDTPWGKGLSASDDDTPWGKTITLPSLPDHNNTPWDDDTPWG